MRRAAKVLRCTLHELFKEFLANSNSFQLIALAVASDSLVFTK
jgi:hypothetical protein